MIWLTIGLVLLGIILISLLIFRPTTREICPRCHEKNRFERVKQSPYLNIVFFWLPHKTYRCYRCNTISMLVGK